MSALTSVAGVPEVDGGASVRQLAKEECDGLAIVIAGHGAGDPGACAHGCSEAERVRALASRMEALGGDAVEVLDTSRNWYADNGISSLSLPSGASQMVELHMDSAGSGCAWAATS